MTGLLILGFVPILAAIMFWIAARRERRDRAALAGRVVQLEAEEAARRAARDRMTAIVAHELRSPLSAILGYQELLADGIYGEIEGAGVDALRRIGHSAHQLLDLIDGLHELSAGAMSDDTEIVPVRIADAVREAARMAAPDGASRGIEVEVGSVCEGAVLADPERLASTLDLMVGAAIKSASGQRVTLSATPDGGDGIDVSLLGAGRDARLPMRDGMPVVETGSALRIAIARGRAASYGARLDASEEGSAARLSLKLRRAPSD
jgi:signal transduction histidine kinase